jgi:hypothetical protein
LDARSARAPHCGRLGSTQRAAVLWFFRKIRIPASKLQQLRSSWQAGPTWRVGPGWRAGPSSCLVPLRPQMCACWLCGYHQHRLRAQTSDGTFFVFKFKKRVLIAAVGLPPIQVVRSTPLGVPAQSTARLHDQAGCRARRIASAPASCRVGSNAHAHDEITPQSPQTPRCPAAMEGAEAAKRRQEQLEKEVREYHERDGRQMGSGGSKQPLDQLLASGAAHQRCYVRSQAQAGGG